MKNSILILGIVLVGLTSCQRSLQRIIKNTEDATFIIYTYDEFGSPAGSGSGFFIDADGTGITNYHVLDGSVKAIIKTTDGTEYEIDKVLASDKNWDIVKFSIKSNGDTFKPLRFSRRQIEQGSVVYNISSPLGLEKTVSNGIVSALREDKLHGDIVQISAPISSGSSGSPILDRNGNVVAVATMVKRGGQNLNFGVRISAEKLELMTENDFVKTNKKFNSKSNFIILNIPSDKSAEITLNAIEFEENVTTLYMSYTNLNMAGGLTRYIWCELDGKDKGFTLEDNNSKKDYYVTSSSIGVDRDNGTKVPLATTLRFKIYLPAIKDRLKNISVYGYGKNDGRWEFKDIDLNKYRAMVNVNFDDYNRNYALAILHEGSLSDSQDLLTEIIDENPDDILALNTLGIISFAADNKSNALYYFGQAIKSNPNDEMAYVNRYAIYKDQQNYSAALDDINKAISIDPDQPENFAYRGYLYMDMRDWYNAKKDWDKVLDSEDFKRNPYIYLQRIYANAYLNNCTEVCKDVVTAYYLTNDSELVKTLKEIWSRCGCRQ